MSLSNAELSQRVLEMPMEDRAALLDRIFDSIDSELDKDGGERMRRWAEESERRVDAVERGELKMVDGPKALAGFRRMLEK